MVVAITGASGAIYGQRLVEVLLQQGAAVHLTISESGRHVLRHELSLAVDLESFDLRQLLPHGVPDRGTWSYFHYQDMLAPIASGSFRTAAMVVCPCSGSTMSAIATARGDNLIHRAADVHLKERRRLIVVPRETPLSLAQIDNWRTVTLNGGVVVPAAPGFYHGAERVGQLVDFVVARILDLVGVEHLLMRRWGTPS